MPSASDAPPRKGPNRYQALIDKIFFDQFNPGLDRFTFRRIELKRAADDLGIALPDNLGDVIYSFRFRAPFSARLLATQPAGMEWRIELAGRAIYEFVLARQSRILPNPALVRTKIPDATPEVIAGYALDDEQALLAIIRYNRLIDVFLGITTYSLQSHLRTSVKKVGQIEIDELYVGLDSTSAHYLLPVQAKGGRDQISVVQTRQDMLACAEKFPGIACRPISVQFMAESVIAMFELTIQDEELRVVQERHYVLVPHDGIDAAQVRGTRRSAGS